MFDGCGFLGLCCVMRNVTSSLYFYIFHNVSEDFNFVESNIKSYLSMFFYQQIMPKIHDT